MIDRTTRIMGKLLINSTQTVAAVSSICARVSLSPSDPDSGASGALFFSPQHFPSADTRNTAPAFDSKHPVVEDNLDSNPKRLPLHLQQPRYYRAQPRHVSCYSCSAPQSRSQNVLNCRDTVISNNYTPIWALL